MIVDKPNMPITAENTEKMLTQLFTLVPALYDGLRTAGFEMPALTHWMEANLPLFGYGLGWVSFAVVGFILALCYVKFVKKAPTTV